MANDIVNVNSTHLVEIPSLSPELRKVIDCTETIFSYGTDDGPPVNGAATHSGKWIVPEWVPETVRAEAYRSVPVMRQAVSPVQPQILLRWLNAIFIGTAKPGGESWEAIKPAYCMLLGDIPGACFSRETLKLARDRFKFFPSANEVAELLKPFQTALENEVSRLTVVATLPTSKPRPKDDGRYIPNRAESDEISRKVAGIPGTAKHRNCDDAEKIRVFREQAGLASVSPPKPAAGQPGKVDDFQMAGDAMGDNAKTAAEQHEAAQSRNIRMDIGEAAE